MCVYVHQEVGGGWWCVSREGTGFPSRKKQVLNEEKLTMDHFGNLNTIFQDQLNVSKATQISRFKGYQIHSCLASHKFQS